MKTPNKNILEQPFISYWGLHKSAKVLYVLTTCYFPLYNLDVQDFLAYYPVLGFVQALIYEADEDIEAGYAGKQKVSDIDSWESRKNTIIELLQKLNLEHPSIAKALDNVSEFFRLEKQAIQCQTISHTDIIRISELRSCDVRVLHHILLQILDIPRDPDYFDVLFPQEVLGEIDDDLKCYQEDVNNNDYNTYRMFVRLYGNEAKDYLQAEIIRYENMFQTRLKKLPEATQKTFLEISAAYDQKHPTPNFPEPIIE